MKRRLIIALLGLGTVAGFAAGFGSLHCHRGHGPGASRGHDDFERHVAELCADAALRARRK